MTTKKKVLKPETREPKKRKMKHKPLAAAMAFEKDFISEGLGLVAIYGVDEYSEALVKYLWKDPEVNFHVCDPVEQRVANLTRDIGSRPYSLYRYDSFSHVGFIESQHYPVIVVADHYVEAAKLLCPPHVALVNLQLSHKEWF